MSTSGIYKLSFASGMTYVGQSVDVHERYKQHLESMRKGTAAYLVQKEYNVCGVPEFSVLQVCHPDHLDELEAWYISMQPQFSMLNTKVPRVDPDVSIFVHNPDLANRSSASITVDFTKALSALTLAKMEIEAHKSGAAMAALTKELEALKKPWYKKLLGY